MWQNCNEIGNPDQFQTNKKYSKVQIHGLVPDCSNSIANALELLQSCTKPSKLCV